MPCRPKDMDSAARRVACRAIGCAPAHAVPVGCFVPQFVWVFASREYFLVLSRAIWVYGASVSDTH